MWASRMKTEQLKTVDEGKGKGRDTARKGLQKE